MDNSSFLKASEKARASGDMNFEAFHKGVVMIEKQPWMSCTASHAHRITEWVTTLSTTTRLPL